MERNEWLALNYTLPREPSRVRVSVWRHLKKIGAVNMQQSMWILPFHDQNFRLFNELKDEILTNDGEAFVISFAVDEDGKSCIIEKFNAARDEEYGEVLEQCEDFFKEIDKEIARENFTFAEIEENEEELNKLMQWYAKVCVRDTFQAPLRGKTKTVLEECTEALDRFCDRVYEYNDKA